MVYTMKHKSMFTAREVSEMAIAIALSTVLSFIKVFQMPQGGSITAGSMIPIIYLALRNRPKVAITGAILYGLVQFMVEPFFVHPIQFLLDYPFAFGALGITTLIKKYPSVGASIDLFVISFQDLFSLVCMLQKVLILSIIRQFIMGPIYCLNLL